jgi:hypothetical protein
VGQSNVVIFKMQYKEVNFCSHFTSNKIKTEVIHVKDKVPNFMFLNNRYVPCVAVSAASADSGRITMLLKVVCPLPCRFTLIFVKGSKSPVEVITEMVGCGWILSVMTTKKHEVVSDDVWSG